MVSKGIWLRQGGVQYVEVLGDGDSVEIGCGLSSDCGLFRIEWFCGIGGVWVSWF